MGPIGIRGRGDEASSREAGFALGGIVTDGLIQQDIEQNLSDFVFWRLEDITACHLAVVTDDAWQGVTDVMRGSDLLNSTPHQIHLQELLGLLLPRYLHLPLALAANGQKLSKQNLASPLSLTHPREQWLDVLRFLGRAIPDGMSGGQSR